MSDEVEQVKTELKRRMDEILEGLTSLKSLPLPPEMLAKKLSALQQEGQKLGRIYRWLQEG